MKSFYKKYLVICCESVFLLLLLLKCWAPNMFKMTCVHLWERFLDNVLIWRKSVQKRLQNIFWN